MGLMERLNRLANRLGLISIIESGPGAAAAKVTKREISLGNLVTEVRADQVRALAERPAEMSVAFPEVYEAAGVKAPGHGWTIARLTQLLRTEQYGSLSREAAQKAVLGVLSADGVEVADLLEDAVSRDKALDAYAEFVTRKMEDRTAARRRKRIELEEKIRTLTKEIAELAEQGEADEEEWGNWLEKKRAEEKELAWAVGYLLDEPLITLD